MSPEMMAAMIMACSVNPEAVTDMAKDHFQIEDQEEAEKAAIQTCGTLLMRSGHYNIEIFIVDRNEDIKI